RTILSANDFTAGLVAFFSATSLTAISFWSAWAANARNFLSSSDGAWVLVCAFAETIIAVPISTAQQVIAIRVIFIDLLPQPRNRAGTAMLCRLAPTPERNVRHVQVACRCRAS